MTHGYSLRPNAKGRQGHRTDEIDDQVEGTSTGTGEGRKTLTDKQEEGELGTVDPWPATPDTPRAALNSPVPTQDSKHRATEEDWQRHSSSIVTFRPAISTTTTTTTTTTIKYRIEGPPETWEEIQAARKREEARRFAEAIRIRRKQIVRGFEEELRTLRARIVALCRECEVKVEKVRRKWERDWAFERGEVAVVVGEDGEVGNLVGSDSGSGWQDAYADGGEMAAVDDKNYTPTETSSLTTDNDDYQQWQWSSRLGSAAPCRSRSEGNFQPAPPPPPVRKTQRQQQQQSLFQSARRTHLLSSGMVPVDPLRRSELLEATDSSVTEEDLDSDERGLGTSGGTPTPRHSSNRPLSPELQLQPLRRQPAQLMVIPTTFESSSHGLLQATYGTADRDPDPETRFGGTDTDGDNDSEMDG